MMMMMTSRMGIDERPRKTMLRSPHGEIPEELKIRKFQIRKSNSENLNWKSKTEYDDEVDDYDEYDDYDENADYDEDGRRTMACLALFECNRLYIQIQIEATRAGQICTHTLPHHTALSK